MDKAFRVPISNFVKLVEGMSFNQQATLCSLDSKNQIIRKHQI